MFKFCLKSWDEFLGFGVFEVDIVIIVCDNVVVEVCFVWLGYFV